MATNPAALGINAGRITAPTAAYPYGSAKDDTTGTAGDGTPFASALLNDIYGFQQALLSAAAIVPSGTSDSVTASDYLDSLDVLFPRKAAAANISGDWEWQSSVAQRFGDSAEARVAYLPTYNTNGGLRTLLDSAASWGINDGTIDVLLYNALTSQFVLGSDVSLKGSGDNSQLQLSFDLASASLNRFFIGSTFDTNDWCVLGNVPGGVNGIRNASLDMRRQVQGATSYVNCEINSVKVAAITGAGRVQGTGTFVDLSDRKTKTNIRVLSEVIDSTALVMSFEPVRYDRKPEFGGDTDVDGFIADDWEKVFPQAVEVFDDGIRQVHDLDAKGDFKFASEKDKKAGLPMFKAGEPGDVLKGIQISNAIPHLVAMNQQQQRRIDALEQRLDTIGA